MDLAFEYQTASTRLFIFHAVSILVLMDLAFEYIPRRDHQRRLQEVSILVLMDLAFESEGALVTAMTFISFQSLF